MHIKRTADRHPASRCYIFIRADSYIASMNAFTATVVNPRNMIVAKM